MLRLRFLLVVILVTPVALFGSGAGCSMVTGPKADRSVEHLLATVDSLDAPAQIDPSDTLSVRLQGTVGPNGCYSFDHFDVNRSADRLTLRPVVEHTTAEDIACTAAIVPLDETYAAAPPFEEGTLTVVVPQSDRADVTTTVEVK